MKNRNYLVPFMKIYTSLFRELNLKFDKKTLILLKGQLGSGKTTFVKELLYYKYKFSDANSPTFGIINTYNIKDNLIFHYDLYRINKVSELDEIGLYDNLQIEAIHFIEWPEIAYSFFADKYISINISINSKNSRDIDVTFH